MSEENSANQTETVLMDDAELDALLTQWKETEVALPESFHASVMQQLRAEQLPQDTRKKKSKVVILAEQITKKKTWISATVAAALILCCLPVLQNHQQMAGGMERSASQAYNIKNSTEQDGAATAPMLMTTTLTDTKDSEVSNINAAIAKSAEPSQGMYDYAIAESRTELTPEERLTQAEEELALLEAQLMALDDSVACTAQREKLMEKIDALKAEIKTLQEETATAES